MVLFKFRRELDMIKDENFKVFARNALMKAKPSFTDDDELITYTRKVFKVLNELLSMRGVNGAVKDAMLIAVLLSDLCLNEMPEGLEDLHPMAVRGFLKVVAEYVQASVFDSIMRAVESHEGENSPSDLLKPRPGTAEYEIAHAHAIVKMECITVDVEE